MTNTNKKKQKKQKKQKKFFLFFVFVCNSRAIQELKDLMGDHKPLILRGPSGVMNHKHNQKKTKKRKKIF
jgi:hypothetical protein